MTDQSNVLITLQSPGHVAVSLLNTVHLETMVTNTGTCSTADIAETLHHEEELSATAITLVNVEAVITDVQDSDVLCVDCATEELDTVILVTNNFYVINSCLTTDSIQEIPLISELDPKPYPP